jgi:hypothetical protein
VQEAYLTAANWFLMFTLQPAFSELSFACFYNGGPEDIHLLEGQHQDD